MLVQLVDKQRHGVNVVKSVLFNVGIKGRSVCVTVSNWSFDHRDTDNDINVSVFVSAPEGANVEPFYETGETIAEAVKNMVNSIKGKKNGATTEISEVTPF